MVTEVEEMSMMMNETTEELKEINLDCKKQNVETNAQTLNRPLKVAHTSKRGRKQAKGMIEIEPVVGARDFYPQDMQLRNWLRDQFKNAAKLFCFEEYDAPILELEELYSRKAGEDITKQMYNFRDKDNYAVSLRPEMTPSLARMIIKREKTMHFPIRWFSIAQCWRFETVQLGRKREHYQWNMDVLGVKSINCEVELLAAITSFFTSVGLTSKDVGIKVNSRKVLQQVLEPLGIIDELFAPVCVIIDKMDKLSEEQIYTELDQLGIQREAIDKIKQVMAIRDLDQFVSQMGGNENAAVQELTQIWELAQAYGFQDWLIFDATVVRGLSYYTGIVFEAFDRAKQFRALCGGGRYDTLMNLYGSKEQIAAAGFGMGDVVIMELLNAKGLLPKFESYVDDIIVSFDETLRSVTFALASKLRTKGRRVEIQLIPKKKMAWCYQMADRIGATRMCLIAPDEWEKRLVRIKMLRLSDDDPNKEINIPFDEL